MRSQLVLLALAAALSDSTAWEEGNFASCAWPCVTNWPSPDCASPNSKDWMTCFCSNETLIAEYKSCVDSSGCADSAKKDATELCSKTGAYASATSDWDKISSWKTGGPWSTYHDWTHTWTDDGPWPTGAAGPWGSGSWPEDECPGSDWPGWTKSSTWDKSAWSSEWASWTDWTSCLTTTSSTSPSTTVSVSTTSGTTPVAEPVSTATTPTDFPIITSQATTRTSAGAFTSSRVPSVSVVSQTDGASRLRGGENTMGFMSVGITLVVVVFLGMVVGF